MQKVIFQLTTALLAWTLFLPMTATAQSRLEKPVFKDGDWWKVKLEVLEIEGMSRSGVCWDNDDLFLVKIVGRKRKVFVGEKLDEEIRCPNIAARHLGSLKKNRLTIPLPMAVGDKKSFRVKPRRRNWQDLTVKVKSHKKTKYLGREITVFEITRIAEPVSRGRVYEDLLSYSPECKCALIFDRRVSGRAGVKIHIKQTIVDFKVSP